MKRRRRRPEGCVYRRGRVFWLKWTDTFGRIALSLVGDSGRRVHERPLKASLSDIFRCISVTAHEGRHRSS